MDVSKQDNFGSALIHTKKKLPNANAEKLVFNEGDKQLSPPRQGATGEVKIVLNSISGLQSNSQVLSDISNSQYFCTEKTQCEYEIGTARTSIDRDFEKHLQTFLPFETSNLVFSVEVYESFNTRNRKTQPSLSITIDCDVSLLSVDNADPVYKWYPETKLDKAKQYYASAVELFKQARYLDSFYLFQPAYRLTAFVTALCDTDKPAGDADALNIVEDARKLNVNCLNNMAACHFQWSNHRAVIQLSSRVLEINPGQVKALYRRGVSYLVFNEFDSSEQDLVKAAKIDPSNRAVQEQLGEARKKRRRGREEMANKMSKMFG